MDSMNAAKPKSAVALPAGAEGAMLPPETPLAMLPQVLSGSPPSPRRAQFKPMPTVWRRIYILTGTAAMTIAGG